MHELETLSTVWLIMFTSISSSNRTKSKYPEFGLKFATLEFPLSFTSSLAFQKGTNPKSVAILPSTLLKGPMSVLKKELGACGVSFSRT